MDKELIEELAQSLFRLYAKKSSGATVKWEKIPGDQRSIWRLVARSAIEHITDHLARNRS